MTQDFFILTKHQNQRHLWQSINVLWSSKNHDPWNWNIHQPGFDWSSTWMNYVYLSKLSKSKLLDPLGGTWPVTFVYSMKPGCSKGTSSLLLANPMGSAPWVFRILLHRIKWICLTFLGNTIYHHGGGGLVMFGVPIRGLRQNRIAPFFKVGRNSLRKLK